MAATAERFTSTGKKIRRSLLGRKVGMTQIFDENGTWVPVTLLEVGPCTVLQVKTVEQDGYSALQVAFGPRKKKISWPQGALFEKIGVPPQRWIREVPALPPGAESAVTAAASGSAGPEGRAAAEPSAAEASTEPAAPAPGADSSGGGEPPSTPVEGKEGAGSTAAARAEGGIKAGDRIGVSLFHDVKRVDVGGISKGRGFSGVIRRHHFNAGPKSHGTKNIREPGSTGMHTDPGRVLKGKRMPGHLGAAKAKTRNLKVLRVEPEKNLLLVRGAVPGPNGGLVYVEESLRQK